MAELRFAGTSDVAVFVVVLEKRDDVLQINDRVVGLYAGQAAPENVSELERPNYG